MKYILKQGSIYLNTDTERTGEIPFARFKTNYTYIQQVTSSIKLFITTLLNSTSK